MHYDFLNEITNEFLQPNPSSRVCLLTGHRGTGKTAALRELHIFFEKQTDWVVLDLNPKADLLRSMAYWLTSDQKLGNIFKEMDLNLSAFGFLDIDSRNQMPVPDPETVLLDELDQLRVHEKSVLILMDDIVCSESVKAFISEFQIWVRHGYNVFLIGAGLSEDINNLKNKDTLTYLWRSPTISL